MVIKNTIMKVKRKYILIIVFSLVFGFIGLILISNQQASHYIEACFDTEIDTIQITGYEKYGSLRGAVFYKKSMFVNTSALLIENPFNYNDWKSNGPIIDFNSEPHSYTLDDLGLPYTLAKKANSDTIYIEKDGHILKFLMIRGM